MERKVCYTTCTEFAIVLIVHDISQRIIVSIVLVIASIVLSIITLIYDDIDVRVLVDPY
jgi:hypothetical protein